MPDFAKAALQEVTFQSQLPNSFQHLIVDFLQILFSLLCRFEFRLMIEGFVGVFQKFDTPFPDHTRIEVIL